MTVQQTRETALARAEHYEKEAQSLIDQYGTGVRPSWVSCDLSIAQHNASRYRKLADDLQVKEE